MPIKRILACCVLLFFSIGIVLGDNKAEIKLSCSYIVEILNTKDGAKYLHLEKILNKEWNEHKFSEIAELDNLFSYCSMQIREFDWNKYFELNQQQLSTLSPKENNKLLRNFLLLDLLAKGYILNNAVAINYSKTIKDNKQLQIPWEKLLCKARFDYAHYQAKLLLSFKYEKKLSYLLSLLKENIDVDDDKARFFLYGICEDKEFYSTLNNAPDIKKEVLVLIKKDFSKIKGNSPNDINIRKSFVRLFINLEDTQNAMQWLRKIIEIPYIIEQERYFYEKQIKFLNQKSELNPKEL